jgi:hypothetical protein
MYRPIAVAAALLPALVGCGSSTSTTAGGAASTSPASVASATGTMSCSEFDQTAAHLVTYANDASLNVGTTNDSTGYFTEMKDAMAGLSGNAAAFAAAASDAIAALRTATEALATSYAASTDTAAVSTDKAAFAVVVTNAKAAWAAMGKDATIWDTVLKYSA